MWMGRGKIDELAKIMKEKKIRLVIFDDEISSGQIRNIEKIIEGRVITRAELILDIFAYKARTHEAKMQVEMAKLEFSLTRLRHLWTHLEGQTGGIGVRGGAGEKQIEVDRQSIKDQIGRHRKKLDSLQKRRSIQRNLRLGFPVAAVVGYTNVGKSTLINKLSKSDLYVEDKLFATLDAMTRRTEIAPDRFVLLTDTVGFIRKFPPQLAASFRSTIEEAIEADFLIHVADATHPNHIEQIETVERFLKERGAYEKKMIRVLNKMDTIKKSLEFRKRLPPGNWIPISAKTGAGIFMLKESILDML